MRLLLPLPLLLLLVLCTCGCRQQPHFAQERARFYRDGVIRTTPDSLYAARNSPELRQLMRLRTTEETFSYSSIAVFLEKEEELIRLRKQLSAVKLPPGARIIEFAPLPQHPHRALLLWMHQPLLELYDDEFYTCPEVTHGKGFYIGQSYISLLDLKTKKLINTVEIEAEDSEYGYLPIPVSILNPAITNTIGGLKYRAIGGTDSTEGKAIVLHLEDFNGDGQKLEFALYQQGACMGCATTLFGYSPRQDIVLQYKVELQCQERFYTGETEAETGRYSDSTYTRTSSWIDYAFCYRADSLGRIKYEIDYRGRAGWLDRYELRFNKEKERFEGTYTNIPQPGDEEEPLQYYSQPRQIKQEK